MNPSLSARISSQALDEARRHPLAVPHPGFEPSNMKQVGFDRFAEQIWTREARSRAIARDEWRSPVANNPSLPYDTARALNEVPSATAIEAPIRTLEHETSWVRQICGTNLDARSAVPSDSEG
jgi:hypothetical protein